jgi:hypothetical protein
LKFEYFNRLSLPPSPDATFDHSSCICPAPQATHP